MGQIVMGIGVLCLGAAFIMTIVTAATASGAKRKMEQRMKEKY